MFSFVFLFFSPLFCLLFSHKMPTITNLPIEIISTILFLLSKRDIHQCSLVNKIFYLASVPLLWKEFIITTSEKFTQFINALDSASYHCRNSVEFIDVCDLPIKDEELLKLLSLVPCLETIWINFATTFADKSIMQIPHYCKHLKSLMLQSVNISDQSALALSQCLQLKEIYFTNCPNMTSKALYPLTNLPIETLTLSNCDYMMTSETARVIRSFAYLKHLSLFDSDNDSPEFLRCLTGDTTNTSCMPNLQRLYITMPLISFSAIEPIFVSFLKTHTHIRELYLHFKEIPESILKAAICHLPVLELVHFTSLRNISGKSVLGAVNHLSKLSSLTIYADQCHDLDVIGICNKSGSCNINLENAQIKSIRASQVDKQN